jgi:hypothetical protein
MNKWARRAGIEAGSQQRKQRTAAIWAGFAARSAKDGLFGDTRTESVFMPEA